VQSLDHTESLLTVSSANGSNNTSRSFSVFLAFTLDCLSGLRPNTLLMSGDPFVAVRILLQKPLPIRWQASPRNL
jgi:hypothetical protein